MNAHQKIDVWSNQDVEDSLVEFFSSAHWTDYVRKLESGPHIRHAHIYNDGVVDPRSIARLLTFYFQKFDRSLQRRIKILPLNEDFMNVYNVHPKGQCHWEFFINYAPEVLVRPADAFSARAAVRLLTYSAVSGADGPDEQATREMAATASHEPPAGRQRPPIN